MIEHILSTWRGLFLDILLTTAIIIGFIGWLEVRRGKKLGNKLDDMHADIKGGHKTLHDRLDREANEHINALERVRTAVAELRKDFIDWWRRK